MDRATMAVVYEEIGKLVIFNAEHTDVVGPNITRLIDVILGTLKQRLKRYEKESMEKQAADYEKEINPRWEAMSRAARELERVFPTTEGDNSTTDIGPATRKLVQAAESDLPEE